MSGQGHPLPGSDEARHNEIPENIEREKGRGADSRPLVQPDEAVTPDGTPYRYDDLGRGPEAGAADKENEAPVPMPDREGDPAGARPRDNGRDAGANRGSMASKDEFASDQFEHQDRGQSVAEAEVDDPEQAG